MLSISEFSKGHVKPKYKEVEIRFSIVHQFIMGGIVFIAALILSVYLMKFKTFFGFVIILLVPFVWSYISRTISVKKESGTFLEFDEQILSIVNGDGEMTKVSYAEIKSIRIKICIRRLGFENSRLFSSEHAYSIRMRVKSGKTYEFNLLNEMYATGTDILHFKANPPEFTSILKYLSNKKLVKLYDWKGKPFQHF